MNIGKRLAAYGVGFAFSVIILNTITVFRFSEKPIKLIIGLLVSLLLVILKFIAFIRLDTPKEKGWRIFLLIVGIFGFFLSSQAIFLGEFVNSIIDFLQALCFMLTYILRTKIKQSTRN